MGGHYLQPSPSGLGLTSSHLYAVVGPLDRVCMTFALPADGATDTLACAAWTALAHRAGLHESSFYRLSGNRKLS